MPVRASEFQRVLDHARYADTLDDNAGLLPGDVRVLFGNVAVGGVDRRGRAGGHREGATVRHEISDDDLARAEVVRPQRHRLADRTRADDEDWLTGLRRRLRPTVEAYRERFHHRPEGEADLIGKCIGLTRLDRHVLRVRAREVAASQLPVDTTRRATAQALEACAATKEREGRDSIALREALYLLAEPRYHSGELMSEDAVTKIHVVHHVEVRAADATRLDAHEKLVSCR